MSEKINSYMPAEGNNDFYNDGYENKAKDYEDTLMDDKARETLKNSLRQILEQRKDDADNVMGDEYYDEVAATLSQMEREDSEPQPNLDEGAYER